MNTARLQFNDGVKFSEEIMTLMALPDEKYYQPDLSVGDTVNVFDGESIVSMTVADVSGDVCKEYTLQDLCGFFYLAEAWRWTEDLGDILKTKTSLRHKRSAGHDSRCRCGPVKSQESKAP